MDNSCFGRQNYPLFPSWSKNWVRINKRESWTCFKLHLHIPNMVPIMIRMMTIMILDLVCLTENGGFVGSFYNKYWGLFYIIRNIYYL